MSARKPLDLTVHDLEAFPHLVAKARATTRRKRLTDAELSAEMWRQAAWIGALGRSYAMPDRYIAFDAAFHEGPATEDEYQWTVLHRFATRPHYDEADQ